MGWQNVFLIVLKYQFYGYGTDLVLHCYANDDVHMTDMRVCLCAVARFETI